MRTGTAATRETVSQAWSPVLTAAGVEGQELGRQILALAHQVAVHSLSGPLTDPGREAEDKVALARGRARRRPAQRHGPRSLVQGRRPCLRPPRPGHRGDPRRRPRGRLGEADRAAALRGPRADRRQPRAARGPDPLAPYQHRGPGPPGRGRLRPPHQCSGYEPGGLVHAPPRRGRSAAQPTPRRRAGRRDAPAHHRRRRHRHPHDLGSGRAPAHHPGAPPRHQGRPQLRG